MEEYPGFEHDPRHGLGVVALLCLAGGAFLAALLVYLI